MAEDDPRAGRRGLLRLAVADGTPEGLRAARCAALLAARAGGRAALFAAAEPPAGADWASLADEIAAEERGRAERLLAEAGAAAQAVSGEHPELLLETGPPREALLALLEREPRVATLVLAASPGPRGPGPLVSALAGRMLSRLRAPLLVLPARLQEISDEELAALF